MPEQIITFTDEEIARMFKSGEMRILTAPAEVSTQPVKSELQLADLKTPKHHRDYFTYSLSKFLEEEVKLSLPSQKHVDLGKRILDAGFTTYEPVAFPDMVIKQDFIYPPGWKVPLNPWIYGQVKENNLKPDVIVLKQLYGWLDISIRLDWKNNDPMFDESSSDQRLGKLLSELRKKGGKGGIAVPDFVKHLDPRSPFGVSADETRDVVYPALAKTWDLDRGHVRDLTAAEFNFIGNLFYPYFGEANSWERFGNEFGVVRRLIGGFRGGGGLGRVDHWPAAYRPGLIRFRPLVVSPS